LTILYQRLESFFCTIFMFTYLTVMKIPKRNETVKVDYLLKK
jgi:hypothetical protein